MGIPGISTHGMTHIMEEMSLVFFTINKCVNVCSNLTKGGLSVTSCIDGGRGKGMTFVNLKNIVY